MYMYTLNLASDKYCMVYVCFLSVVTHVEQVLAIELLSACQALEFHRPRKTTDPLEDVHKVVRTVVRWVCYH